MKKLLLSFLILVSYFLFLIAPAANATISNPVLNNGTVQTETPKTYINNVINGIFTMFFIIGILYFLWHGVFAGLHLMETNGDSKLFEAAKNELTFSLTGLVLIFGVYAILRVIGTVFGITGLNDLTIIWPSLN